MHIIQGGREPLIIPDLNKNDLTKHMELTKGWGGGSLIGIPIISKTGKKFGTLCGMDDRSFDFQEKDVLLFRRMAALLTYILEVDNAHQEVLKLSTPIVLVSARVGILPIIGDINAKRSDQMMETILLESKRLDLEHLVIDLSGITDIEQYAATYLMSIVKTLKLLGVEIVFCGMRPDLAKKAIFMYSELKQATFCSNLRSGLSSIGCNVISK
ncbi:STAS domain-containing protein [Metaplanococcus flavidus]|uniref:STAS domain-containing protein n=1 Tax=Metaplanococcus flavidus TaxID=569883 RepID=A0ABW3LFY3_9BACL